MALTEQQYQAYAAAILGINNGQYGVRNDVTGQVVGAYDIIPWTYNDISERHPSANLGTSDTRTPEQEDRAMRILADEEAAALERSGLPVTIQNLAVTHFFGVGGGPLALRADPNARVVDLFRNAYGDDYANAFVRDNPNQANWTVADAQNWGANLAGDTPMAFADTGAAPAPGIQAANQMAAGGNPDGGAAQEAPSAFPRLQRFIDRQQMREQGRLPIIENIRDRLRSRGRDTPFLDMIINSAAKGRLVVPRVNPPSQDKTTTATHPQIEAPNLDATNPAPPTPGSLIPPLADGMRFALPQPQSPPAAPASSVPMPSFRGTTPMQPVGPNPTWPGDNDAEAAQFYQGGASDYSHPGLETTSLIERFSAPAGTSPYAASQPASPLANAGSGLPLYVPPANNLAEAGQTYQSPVLRRVLGY